MDDGSNHTLASGCFFTFQLISSFLFGLGDYLKVYLMLSTDECAADMLKSTASFPNSVCQRKGVNCLLIVKCNSSRSAQGFSAINPTLEQIKQGKMIRITIEICP